MTREKTERNAEIVKRAKAGEAYTSIARDLGLTPQRCRNLAIKGGVPARRNPVGESHPNWKGEAANAVEGRRRPTTVRLSSEEKDVLKQASDHLDVGYTAFMREAALRRAHEVISSTDQDT